MAVLGPLWHDAPRFNVTIDWLTKTHFQVRGHPALSECAHFQGGARAREKGTVRRKSKRDLKSG